MTARPFALVTGANGGVGRALTARLAEAGWRVLANGRRDTSQDPLVTEYLPADLSREDGVKTLVAWTRRAVGGEGLGLLAHCAGSVDAVDAEDSWAAPLGMYALHCLAFAGLSLGLADELSLARGTAVGVSSSSAQRFAPGQLHYGASKAALEGTIRHLAHQLGPRSVRVVGVRPTILDSPMAEGALGRPGFRRYLTDRIPLGRLGTPEDIAQFIALLAAQDPSAAWLTGQTVWLDGGASTGWNEEGPYARRSGE